MMNARATWAASVVASVIGLGAVEPAGAIPLGTGFTYQGQLTDAGSPANGGYDFQFTLHTCDVVGAQVGPTVTLDDVVVNNGLFTVRLNFGAVFTDEARCLEIGVRPGSATGGDPYTILDPRQPLTPAPSALYAASAPWNGLTGIPAGFQDGTDDDTTYVPGTGLNLVDNQFRIDFGGNGSAPSVAHSDHSHAATGWQLTGNTGTTPGTNFLGTIDNAALQLHVGNARALRLEPGGTSPNFIAGHSGNSAGAGVQGATISGGGANGSTNRVTDQFGTVGGGEGNQAGNGAGTTVDRRHATVAGGAGNVASGDASAIGGGGVNSATASYSTVSGGQSNVTSGDYSAIGGGSGHQASGDYATVGGGLDNTASQDYATVGGGVVNRATGINATVAGGDNNDAEALNATVGGGEGNRAGDTWSTVGGGNANTASGLASTVAGGGGNSAGGTGASIGGGSENEATGGFATIPGGDTNDATADYTFAAGRRAKAVHIGAFVWADSTNADFASTKSNQVSIRAANGLRLSADAGSALTVGVGERYRDNAIVAWGKVQIDFQNNNQPVLQQEFGVSNVTRTAAGNYAVDVNATADTAGALIPIAIAEVENPPANAAAMRIVSINQIDANTFRVYINDGSGALVDNDFVFMVTAR